MRSEDLLNEVASAFPPMDMPPVAELPFHVSGCFQCDWLKEELESRRGKPVEGDLIRLVHQELSCLSAKAWRWIAPHYISYCLNPEAVHNQMEAEYLVYNLGPEDKFKEDVLNRFSLFNGRQIHCFTTFMEYLANHEYWSEYFPEDIRKAANFLSAMEPSRASPPP